MNKLKNKNIFNNFDIKRNNTSIKNIISLFGERIIDLLVHTPISINLNLISKEIKVKDIDNTAIVDLIVIKHEKNYNRRSPYKVICKNSYSQIVEILFFNMKEIQLKNYLTIQHQYRVTGKILFKNGKFQIIHPTNVLNKKDINDFEKYEPIYDLSRKNINKKIFRKLIKSNVENIDFSNFPNEWIEKEFMNKSWSSFKESILQIHFPKNINQVRMLENNRKRLAFDELLSSYLTFYELKKKRQKDKLIKIIDFKMSDKIRRKLPFNLTKDQLTSMMEIKSNLKKGTQMYRLIQGDVGSGKTIVALLMAADVVNNGYQVVLMAPTEILANQHFEYFKNHLLNFRFKIALITGKTKDKEKIYEKLSNGYFDILIGTHSVYNTSVSFKKLGLIIIDEQHKFGVKQRIKLIEKSIGCHTLIMSATPIPRSLSFSIYGEIEISNIKSKPIGRKEPITSIISIEKINNLLEGIQRKIRKSEQVFWVLPNIGSVDSEKETLHSRYEFLKKKFGDIVCFLHGKMKKDDVEEIMNNFRQKKTMILVATTVIEVGINIPDATLMVIEQSERFGLSQLHQLRGRISRGNLESNCVLIHNQSMSEMTKKRLMIIKNSSDGFEIAEKDLFLRGAGDFFGTSQSGLPSWKFFKPHKDYEMLISVKKNSENLVKDFNANRLKIEFLKEIFYNERKFKNFFSV